MGIGGVIVKKPSKNGEVKPGKKVSFTTGGNGSPNSKITFPISWLAEMGVTKENPFVKMSFIDGKIIIEKVDYGERK